MKKAALFLFVAFAATAHGQTLNDLLFSGKLKSDSGSLVRKTDDLHSKIDTTTRKKPVEQPKQIATAQTDNKTNPGTNANVSQTDAPSNTGTTQPANVPVKSNNKIWKEYADALSANLKDVLSSQENKKGFLLFYRGI